MNGVDVAQTPGKVPCEGGSRCKAEERLKGSGVGENGAGPVSGGTGAGWDVRGVHIWFRSLDVVLKAVLL